MRASGLEPTPARSPIPKGASCLLPLDLGFAGAVCPCPALNLFSHLKSGGQQACCARLSPTTQPPGWGGIAARTHLQGLGPQARSQLPPPGWPAGRPDPGLCPLPKQTSEQFVMMKHHISLYLWARISWFRAINPGAASAEWAALLEDQKCQAGVN